MKIGFLKERQLKDTNVLTIYTFLQPHKQGIGKNKLQLRCQGLANFVFGAHYQF
jgi:hypothetical protein